MGKGKEDGYFGKIKFKKGRREEYQVVGNFIHPWREEKDWVEKGRMVEGTDGWEREGMDGGRKGKDEGGKGRMGEERERWGRG